MCAVLCNQFLFRATIHKLYKSNNITRRIENTRNIISSCYYGWVVHHYYKCFYYFVLFFFLSCSFLLKFHNGSLLKSIVDPSENCCLCGGRALKEFHFIMTRYNTHSHTSQHINCLNFNQEKIGKWDTTSNDKTAYIDDDDDGDNWCVPYFIQSLNFQFKLKFA